MTSEAMEAVMARFNRKFVFEGRKSHSFFFVKEFTTDISAAEYTNFNKNVPVSVPMINEFEMDWRQRVREDSINPIQNPEIASDQVEQTSNDDESNKENDKLEQESIGFKEISQCLTK